MGTDRIINLLTILGLIAMMLSMGLQVTTRELLTPVRNLPLMARALTANFIFFPLATLLLLHLFHAEPLVSAGFLILAVRPGRTGRPAIRGVGQR